MKFELKTENENYSQSFAYLFKTVLIIALIIISCDIALKLGMISKYYQIEYNCRLLSVDKSTSIFKNLSKISKIKSKQRIWEFCKEVVK